MNTQDFRNWMAHMGFDKHGGKGKAAQALGVHVNMISLYDAGVKSDGKPVSYSQTLDLACSALAQGLKPFSEYPR